MQFPKSNAYDQQFVNENLMGPNALKILEELTATLDLRSDMKILDLGCGKGLTSIFLAKEYGAHVYAVDLWVGASENNTRFKQRGLDSLITPIHANAMDLPFAEAYFDAVISVDAYHYFGEDASFMDAKLAPFVKQGGLIALAFPGFKQDIHGNLPPEFLLSWKAEDLKEFHSCQWWSKLLAQSKKIQVQAITEMACHEASWNDWLRCDNVYAIGDRKSMEAGAGEHMNIISVIAHKK